MSDLSDSAAPAALPLVRTRRARSQPGRRAIQSERSRNDILEAALQSIARFGFREASIDVIAEAAGISPPTIYWHFGNREGLLAALANRITDAYIAATNAEWAASGASTPEERVRAYVRAVIRLASERPEVIRAQTALSSEGVILPALREGVRNYNRAARRPVAGDIDAGVAAGTFRPVRSGLWMDFLIGSLMGASIQASLHRDGFDHRLCLKSVHDAALMLLGLDPEAQGCESG